MLKKKEHFFFEHRVAQQFDPLDVLCKNRSGEFQKQGSLKALLPHLTTEVVEEKKFDVSGIELVPFELDTEDKTWLYKKHRITLEHTLLRDASHLKDDVVAFIRQHVVVSKEWQEMMGKYIWIVLKVVYAKKFEKVTVGFFQSNRLTLGGDSHPIMVAFTCIRLTVNKDGKIRKIKEI